MINFVYLCIKNNMMRALRNIGTVLLVSLLIAATGGVSIYRNICNCAGEISASVFLETGCDHDNASAPAACCSMEETHSCCAEKPVKDNSSACHDGDCCHTSSQFLKISDSFQPGLEKISLKPIIVASVLLFYDISVEEYSSSSINSFNADLPPPDSGKQIILAFHRLKIAPHLV